MTDQLALTVAELDALIADQLDLMRTSRRRRRDGRSIDVGDLLPARGLTRRAGSAGANRRREA